MQKKTIGFQSTIPFIKVEKDVFTEIIQFSKKEENFTGLLIGKIEYTTEEILLTYFKFIPHGEEGYQFGVGEIPSFLVFKKDSEEPTQWDVDDNYQSYLQGAAETSSFSSDSYYYLYCTAVYTDALHLNFEMVFPNFIVSIEPLKGIKNCTTRKVTEAYYKIKAVNNFVEAYYIGLTLDNDPRIINLSFSLYVAFTLPIHAAINGVLYNIECSLDDKFHIYQVDISSPQKKIMKPIETTEEEEKSDFLDQISLNGFNQDQIISLIQSMHKEIIDLRKQLEEREAKMIELLKERDEEIKDLLNTILSSIRRQETTPRIPKFFTPKQHPTPEQKTPTKLKVEQSNVIDISPTIPRPYIPTEQKKSLTPNEQPRNYPLKPKISQTETKSSSRYVSDTIRLPSSIDNNNSKKNQQRTSTSSSNQFKADQSFIVDDLSIDSKKFLNVLGFPK